MRINAVNSFNNPYAAGIKKIKNNPVAFEGHSCKTFVVKNNEQLSDEEAFKDGVFFPGSYNVIKGNVPPKRKENSYEPDIILEGEVYYADNHEPVWDWAKDNHSVVVLQAKYIRQPVTKENIDKVCYDRHISELRPKAAAAKQELKYQQELKEKALEKLQSAKTKEDKLEARQEYDLRDKKCSDMQFILDRVNYHIRDFLELCKKYNLNPDGTRKNK